ncbi:hypothetical protein BDW59DRAFT_155289 [Aspergillus cavernicola]|uniref:RRM domain-containing protein n=1 Tax=Aspergillus cavernicola TaxID=176166 RepID=A0ABR4HAE0_9EURO
MADAPGSPKSQEQTPQKTYQNGVRTNGRAFNSLNWRMKGEESPKQDTSPSVSPGPRTNTNTSRVGFSRQGQTVVPPAISEGRRLYVGNMPYTAKMEDVQALFNAAGFEVEQIDIAIDPFSGRNPSYCFVDLETKELCERAMAEMDGHNLLGRPVKIKPGVVKSASERQQRTSTGSGIGMGAGVDGSSSPRSNRTSSFNADRWRRDDNAPAPIFGTPTKSNSNSSSTTTTTATTDSSCRLYVGGLPRLTDQESITSNITTFFKEYNVENITKLFTPHPAKRFEPGDHYYLFVDFSSAEEAQNAMAALNGAEGPWGSTIRVQRARGETYSNTNSNANSIRGLNDGEERKSRWGPSTRASASVSAPVVKGVVEA